MYDGVILDLFSSNHVVHIAVFFKVALFSPSLSSIFIEVSTFLHAYDKSQEVDLS